MIDDELITQSGPRPTTLRLPGEVIRWIAERAEVEDRPAANILREAILRGLDVIYGEEWRRSPPDAVTRRTKGGGR